MDSRGQNFLESHLEAVPELSQIIEYLYTWSTGWLLAPPKTDAGVLAAFKPGSKSHSERGWLTGTILLKPSRFIDCFHVMDETKKYTYGSETSCS